MPTIEEYLEKEAELKHKLEILNLKISITKGTDRITIVREQIDLKEELYEIQKFTKKVSVRRLAITDSFDDVKAILKDSKFISSVGTFESAISYYDLSKKMGMAWNKFGDLMRTMEENGAITIHNNVPIPLGRPTRVVQLKSATGPVEPTQVQANPSEGNT